MKKDQNILTISKHLKNTHSVFGAMQMPAFHATLALAGRALNEAFEKGNRMYIAGNGGSAADAQHFAAEIVGWYNKGDSPRSAFALSTDTSFLTAWGNDDNFDNIFARQLEAHAKKGDIFFAISTSGNSKNILRGLETSRRFGVFSIALLGESGGAAKMLADLALCVPSQKTTHIQEAHMAVIHALCECLDRSQRS